jgi:hypothetical protein
LVTTDMLIQANSTLHDLMVTKWFTEGLFSMKWWGVVGFVTFSYILCFSLMDKTRLIKTILFGALMSVFCVVIDTMGCNFNLWAYPTPILPMAPNMFLYDITALPMYYMLIYQHAYSWKSYAVWNIAASAILAFVFTPLLVTLGLFQMIHWTYLNVFLMISFIVF